MGTVLFLIVLIAAIGTFVFPLLSRTRESACMICFETSLLGAAVQWYRLDRFPYSAEPSWAHGATWTAITWILVSAGVVVALRKPSRKKRVD